MSVVVDITQWLAVRMAHQVVVPFQPYGKTPRRQDLPLSISSCSVDQATSLPVRREHDAIGHMTCAASNIASAQLDAPDQEPPDVPTVDDPLSFYEFYMGPVHRHGPAM